MERKPGDWRGMLRFAVLFVILTVVVHSLFGWFHGWLHPSDPYKVPDGRAAKVFQSGTGDDPNGSPGDRLRLFFWYGE